MELDEYEYLERGVENPAAETKKERRSTDGDNRSSRRSMSEERSGGERADRERSSSQLDKDQRHRSSRDDDQDRVRVHRSSERGDDSDRVRPSRERDDDRDRVRRCRESDLDRDRRCRESDLDRDRRSRESDLDRDRRSRERSYDDRHHRRSRDRDHRSRDYEEDMERERRRRRSSSRLYEREVESERVRSRDRLESMERERRRFKERRESVEPEADPERDQRTVFAYQMPLKATERDVYEFFSQAGKVRDVRLIMDRISRRSKGVGYIEFYDAMSVPHAIALSTRLLLGQPVLVKPSEAEKNLIQSNSTVASGVTGAASDRKIYVGNLHYNITEALLRQIFEVFGPLELVQLPLDPTTGYCKGYGFIQFQQLEHAKAARSLNGTLDIAGRIIKVSAVTDHVGGQSTGTNTADFDDEDGGGLALNARSRAILMQKLDRTGTATSIVESLGIPVLNGAVANQQTANLPMPLNAMPMVPPVNAQYLPPFEPIGDPSECLLLKNMFDPSVQVDPDLYMDVKEDVEDECSKFGSVKHIFVDKNTGFVYLRFDSVVSATDCQRAMNKRWYGGKTISATFMRPHEYDVRVASDT